MLCNHCPRRCNIDRSVKRGFCGMGDNLVVSRAFLHQWEEPYISGTKGSGTVFFSGCNLKCIFCQNHEISHGGLGRELTVQEFAGLFLDLQDKGAHNINLVTPSHFVPAIREAIVIARHGDMKGQRRAAFENASPSGVESSFGEADISCNKLSVPEGRPPLSIPIVYNTNAYDSIEDLKLLEGYVDIYLPDLKYISSDLSREYSGAPDYFEVASAAIPEMVRQVGTPVFDGEGILQRGTVIRHLVLPGHTKETLLVLDWIAANLPKEIHVSLMSQYVPCHLAQSHPVLGRRITRHEYDKVVNHFIKLDLNGFVQERESASEQYIPDFMATEESFPK